MYEGGHRVPGLIRWPGRVEAGSRSDQPVIGSDFFPTALRAAGVAIPDDRPIDGVDIFGPVGERAAPMYWRWGGFVAYREGPWKLVADESLATPELYNLATDRAESHDLASREAERCAAMLSRLEMLTAEIEAEGPDWWRGHDFAPKRPRGRTDTTRQGKPAATP
jgi:arylsulfatase A